jgi:hypothetical protein
MKSTAMARMKCRSQVQRSVRIHTPIHCYRAHAWQLAGPAEDDCFSGSAPDGQRAQLSEVRRMIEAHSLFQRGIGLVDAHLIASTFITPHTVLWSRDKPLRDIAETLGLKANIR